MKTINLTQGQVALVDDEDYDYLSQYSWCAWFDDHTKSFYAATTIYDGQTRKTIQMHRLIMSAEKGKLVDHNNHNTLDNRKENLRICNNSQNQRNKGRAKNNKSGYKGVFRHLKKWRAVITTDTGKISLGCYTTKEEAARVYDLAASIHHGEFAYLNFPCEVK